MPSEATFEAASNRVMQRSHVLATCTDSEEGLTRLFCSGAMRAAHECFRLWMSNAGMVVRVDEAGNLIGRRPAAAAGARFVIIGSHLDTVVNAGRHDGTLGVLIGLALAEVCEEEGIELPVALDVVGFSEEEGIRYQSPYIGSRAIAGDLGAGNPLLERLDDEGVRMADALAGFGCDPSKLGDAAYKPEQVAAFLEPHIEQGPVLEQKDLSLGVVTGIAGQTRASFRFVGETGHAGTVPMSLRRDPLPTAARFVHAVEEAARRRPGTLATVGRMDVLPNVANVIPSEVAVRLDLRQVVDDEREACFVEIHRAAMS
ncbi:MAG: Zn-dependent hydrolase, partial [Planctomycetota bacterium]